MVMVSVLVLVLILVLVEAEVYCMIVRSVLKEGFLNIPETLDNAPLLMYNTEEILYTALAT